MEPLIQEVYDAVMEGKNAIVPGCRDSRHNHLE
jgi:hypothetical protein